MYNIEIRDDNFRRYLLEKKMEESLRVLSSSDVAKIISKCLGMNVANLRNEIFKQAEKISSSRIKNNTKTFYDDANHIIYKANYIHDGYYDVDCVEDDELIISWIASEEELNDTMKGLKCDN